MRFRVKVLPKVNMAKDRYIHQPPHGKGLKRIRIIALVVVVICAISWSAKINLGLQYGASHSFYVKLNGILHEGEFIIETGGTPKAAWSNLKIEVNPQPVGSQRTGGSYFTWGNNAWSCISTDQPFHLKFQHSDGTITESIPAIWGHPNQEVSEFYRWSSDGKSIVLGFNKLSDLTNIKLGTHWYLGGTLVALGRSFLIAIPYIIFSSFLVWGFTSRKMWYSFKPHECSSCGYDLSASEGRGCPECGWGRSDEGR